ncbi:hypothetical protein EJ077_01555 [Mesorhizobium sp. M8A.F.Ca.ET.057.01.1.1]|nr:hypothetical protein EJ077_01555 [Mesorhizobium sp. M8A.F.Ca.ET.057.01.1.1]
MSLAVLSVCVLRRPEHKLEAAFHSCLDPKSRAEGNIVSNLCLQRFCDFCGEPNRTEEMFVGGTVVRVENVADTYSRCPEESLRGSCVPGPRFADSPERIPEAERPCQPLGTDPALRDILIENCLKFEPRPALFQRGYRVIDMWSVIRRWHFREHSSIREICRRTGPPRNAIRIHAWTAWSLRILPWTRPPIPIKDW